MNCSICQRPLIRQASIALGIGPVCAHRIAVKKAKEAQLPLFNSCRPVVAEMIAPVMVITPMNR